MSLENFLQVSDSGIHGFGIFTNIFIKEGEKILLIKGEVISELECIKREENDGNVYIFWNGDNYIDASNEPIIKFINHDCNYNCEIIDNDENSLWLIASRNINPCEELSIDYGYDEIYESCSCLYCNAESIRKSV